MKSYTIMLSEIHLNLINTAKAVGSNTKTQKWDTSATQVINLIN